MWDSDMPGALVADEMGHGKMFTSVAVAMIWKLMTEHVVLGLLLSILCRNTLDELVNMAQKNNPGIVSEGWQWDPCGD